MGYSYQKVIESVTTPTLEDGNVWIKDDIVYVPNTTLSAWVEQTPITFTSTAATLSATAAALNIMAPAGSHTSLVVGGLSLIGEVGTAHSGSLYYTATLEYNDEGDADTTLATVSGISIDTQEWTTVDVLNHEYDDTEAIITTDNPIARLVVTLTKTSTAADIANFCCSLNVKRAIVVA